MFILLVTCKDMEKKLDSQLHQREQNGRKAMAFSCLEMMYVGNNKFPLMFTEDLHSDEPHQGT